MMRKPDRADVEPAGGRLVTTLSRTLGSPVSRVEGGPRWPERRATRPRSRWLVWRMAGRAGDDRRGRVRSIEDDAVLRMPGVLGVITHENAPRLQVVDDGELLVLQDQEVHYRGQTVALVVASTLEQAPRRCRFPARGVRPATTTSAWPCRVDVAGEGIVGTSGDVIRAYRRGRRRKQDVVRWAS